MTKVNSEFSNLTLILAGVPQGANLSTILYNMYAADQPISPYKWVAEAADNKIIFISNDNLFIATICQPTLAKSPKRRNSMVFKMENKNIYFTLGMRSTFGLPGK